MRKIKEGQSNKEIFKIKTAARFLSIGTQQLYEKGKEEMEKKKNRRFGNYYYWQLKIFPPNHENWCFTRVCTSLARNENKRERNQHNRNMEGVIPIKYPSSDTSCSFSTLPAHQPQLPTTSNKVPVPKGRHTERAKPS